MGAAFGEDIYVISVDGTWALHTHTAGQGPIVVGFAHADLTVAEISECIKAELTDPDDIITRERARRPVRQVGAFNGLNTDETLYDGVAKRTTIKISIGNDHNLALYAFNRSGAPLTTGSKITVDGVLYGRWQR